MSEHLPELALALRRVTDERLRRLVGAGSFQRGEAYSRQRRVSGLRILGPTELSATVRGSGHSYSTSVEFDEAGSCIGGECSCPIGGDCKHVVAVALTARQTLGTAGAGVGSRSTGEVVTQRPVLRAAPPVWESLLGGLASHRQPHGPTLRSLC